MMMDIVREILMDKIEKKVLEFNSLKEVYEYNSFQLELILKKLENQEELSMIEHKYLDNILMQNH